MSVCQFIVSDNISHMRYLCNSQSDTAFAENGIMETFGSRVRARRKELTLSQTELAKKAGLSQTTISDIERERNDGSSEILAIAKALQCRPEWLKHGGVDKELQGLAGMYAGLEPNTSPGPNIQEKKVPIISWVKAGEFCTVIDLNQPGIAEDWIDTTVPIKKHTFALRVVGDSMEPEFPEGTIIIVEPEMEAVPGDFVIARNENHEATFKQLTKDGSDWYLKPLNPRYPLKPLTSSDEICGVVRSAERRFR